MRASPSSLSNVGSWCRREPEVKLLLCPGRPFGRRQGRNDGHPWLMVTGPAQTGRGPVPMQRIAVVLGAKASRASDLRSAESVVFSALLITTSTLESTWSFTRTFYYMTARRIHVRRRVHLCRHHRQVLTLEMLANARAARTPGRGYMGQQRWT